LVVGRSAIKQLVCLGGVGNKTGCGSGEKLGLCLQICGDEYHAFLFIKDAKGFQRLDIKFVFMCEFCLYIDRIEMVFML
jgi:hypothetical protein